MLHLHIIISFFNSHFFNFLHLHIYHTTKSRLAQKLQYPGGSDLFFPAPAFQLWKLI
jgi:hypothetical protein